MKKSRYFLPIIIILIFILSLITKSGILQIIASISGIIYMFLNIKENKYGQLFGVVNAAIYGYLMLKDGLYGTTIYDFFYCIPIQIFTFFTWGKDNKGKSKKEISKYSNIKRFFIAFGLLSITILYAFFATKLNVSFAFVDGISIILGAFGMYALSQKKIENWYSFIISNIVTILYWTYKCMENSSNTPMFLMWTIYLINNSYGLYSWNKKLNKKDLS